MAVQAQTCTATVIFGVRLFPFRFAAVGVGAGIGFLAAGRQPLVDAGIAYFSGQS